MYQLAGIEKETNNIVKGQLYTHGCSSGCLPNDGLELFLRMRSDDFEFENGEKSCCMKSRLSVLFNIYECKQFPFVQSRYKGRKSVNTHIQ